MNDSDSPEPTSPEAERGESPFEVAVADRNVRGIDNPQFGQAVYAAGVEPPDKPCADDANVWLQAFASLQAGRRAPVRLLLAGAFN